MSDLTICPFHIALSLALDGEGAPIHVEFQRRLEYHSHDQGKGNTKSVKGDGGVFSPCTDCTLDQ